MPERRKWKNGQWAFAGCHVDIKGAHWLHELKMFQFLPQQMEPQFEDWGAVSLDGSSEPDIRRWLMTDGTGSFMSSALTGAKLSRYDGVVLALIPPVSRFNLLSGTDETLTVEPVLSSAGPTKRTEFELATNYWRGGHVAPEGWQYLKSFSYAVCPTWAFELKEGWFIKQACMLQEKRCLVLGYSWVAKSAKVPTQLRIELVANCRDFHHETKGNDNWQFKQVISEGRVEIRAYESAPLLTVRFDRGRYQQSPSWWWGYFWPEEHARGLGDSEDCFHVGSLTAQLADRESLTICAALGDVPHVSINEAVKQTWRRRHRLLRQAGDPKNVFLRALTLAADQFLVQRESSNSKSVIAGYPWFNDWGRDTMISLPGLCLCTGRSEDARSILETFGRYCSEGMLPNNFPDTGEEPHYNNADATLWWAWALKEYYDHTGDLNLVREQLPLLGSVVHWHIKGTRYSIKVDPDDGLVSAGESGVQLTWMDAKVGDYVVTPREGKPVEITALWYNFLCLVQYFCDLCSEQVPGEEWRESLGHICAQLAERAKAGFDLYWIEESGYLADVLRRDGSRDLSLRPNMLIALSLQHPILDKERGKLVLEAAEKHLLTPYGLRTLSPDAPAYCGQYGGGKASANQYDRDITYHQGTVWPWLLGPWVDARLSVYGPTKGNLEFMEKHFSALEHHTLYEACVGSVSEIFDGDPPHKPRGCFAQAWSVAELLRVLKKIHAIKEKIG
jgi:predicted glycogen debranching enzyme